MHIIGKLPTWKIKFSLYMLLALNWQNFKKSKNWKRTSGYVVKTNDSLRILKYLNPIVLWFWFFEILETNWLFDFDFFQILGINNLDCWCVPKLLDKLKCEYKVKTTKKQEVKARSLARSTLGVKGCVRAPGWD
jgi:hypothetical protein